MTARDWTSIFARYLTLTPDAVADRALLEATVRNIGEEVVLELRRAGWSRDELRRWGISVELGISDSHADFRTRRLVALLAEARALDLRTPNPFPPCSWWPAVDRAEKELLEHARRIRRTPSRLRGKLGAALDDRFELERARLRRWARRP